MMAGCVGLVLAGVALAALGVGSAGLLIVIPCVLMVGAMIWMLVRAPGA